ncbi:putative protoporphyrinogen oxidase [unidentified eubacterium SCB49]|nr:putative protoporphyrinogen oxidase [unidentified eubacterium SCB49]
MTFKEQRLAFAEILKSHYPLEEINSFFYLLTEHYFGFNKFETHQKGADVFPVEHEQHISEAIQRLLLHEPIQYIIGETAFYGLPFKVDRHTLIPRPETEELVEWILVEAANNEDDKEILDIGTGSGCIAVSLAKEFDKAQVSAYDISEGALKVAQENALTNKVEVRFKNVDILALDELEQSFDVIVSNPPYVRDLEKKMMQANVLEHEPATALFVSDTDPLIFYRKIAALAFKSLKKNGLLYFEINEYLGEEMKVLMKEMGFNNCIIKKDIYGKDRMMRAER